MSEYGTLAENLATIRRECGLTQAELGKRAGINPAQIGHYEVGDREPSLSNAIALANALGTSLDRLTGRVGKTPWNDGYRRGAFDTREAMKEATKSFCLSGR